MKIPLFCSLYNSLTRCVVQYSVGCLFRIIAYNIQSLNNITMLDKVIVSYS